MIAESIAGSGLHGAMFALMSLAFTSAQRMTALPSETTGNPPPLTAAERSVWSRRGPIVGLGIGAPFFGGLIALCLSAGLSHAYAISFGVALVVMTMVAIRNLRRRPPVSAS